MRTLAGLFLLVAALLFTIQPQVAVEGLLAVVKWWVKPNSQVLAKGTLHMDLWPAAVK